MFRNLIESIARPLGLSSAPGYGAPTIFIGGREFPRPVILAVPAGIFLVLLGLLVFTGGSASENPDGASTAAARTPTAASRSGVGGANATGTVTRTPTRAPVTLNASGTPVNAAGTPISSNDGGTNTQAAGSIGGTSGSAGSSSTGAGSSGATSGTASGSAGGTSGSGSTAPLPTQVPAAPAPTATPVPFIPTATPVPAATSTPIPAATDTPVATNTPAATATPAATSTPAATATPACQSSGSAKVNVSPSTFTIGQSGSISASIEGFPCNVPLSITTEITASTIEGVEPGESSTTPNVATTDGAGKIPNQNVAVPFDLDDLCDIIDEARSQFPDLDPALIDALLAQYFWNKSLTLEITVEGGGKSASDTLTIRTPGPGSCS